jgi:hypothetical protein
MKISLQYVTDINGDTQAVQLPINEWEKVVNKIKKYEQALRLKTDLKAALEQVMQLQQAKEPKQTLKDFLDEI